MVARGLGKGLDALIPSRTVEQRFKSDLQNKEAEKPEFFVDINKVERNKEQPRDNFDEDTLLELADSIKQFGVLQPILVQDRDDYYEIIAGERRWRAAKMAGLKEIPVIIRKYTDQEIVEISLIENIQREDLNEIEEARAYRRLILEFNLKQDEIAERVSKSRTAVTNAIRLLKLCDEVQKMIIDDMITAGHGRALIAIDDPKEQYALAQKIFDEKMSVRDAERYIKSLSKPKKEKKQEDVALGVIYQEKAELLKRSLSTKVSVVGKGNGKGKIEIEFFSHDDFDRLMEMLT